MNASLENDPMLLRRKHGAELFLIRHGDAIPGPEEIIPSGRYDDLPLSATGRKQAEALAERLQNLHFDAAYSSPLRRCRETAAPLNEKLGLPLTIVEELKEIRIGEVIPLPEFAEGSDLSMLTQALQERQREIVRIAATNGNWDAIPGSEPGKKFRQRVVISIDSIAQKHNGERVLLFVHGGVINAYAAEVLGLDKEFFFPCANTSINVVRVAGTQRILFGLNDVGHLKLE